MGAYVIWEDKADSAGGVPIKGRYITIQRFKTPIVNKELLALAEVDVEIYV